MIFLITQKVINIEVNSGEKVDRVNILHCFTGMAGLSVGLAGFSVGLAGFPSPKIRDRALYIVVEPS